MLKEKRAEIRTFILMNPIWSIIYSDISQADRSFSTSFQYQRGMSKFYLKMAYQRREVVVYLIETVH